MTEPPKSIPCELSEPDRDERGEEWRALGPLLRSRRRTGEGFRLTFAPAARERIEHLAAAEQSCCSWATWSISARAGDVVLDVTGPHDQLDALAAAFGV
jgi:hypothetical protein